MSIFSIYDRPIADGMSSARVRDLPAGTTFDRLGESFPTGGCARMPTRMPTRMPARMPTTCMSVTTGCEMDGRPKSRDAESWHRPHIAKATPAPCFFGGVEQGARDDSDVGERSQRRGSVQRVPTGRLAKKSLVAPSTFLLYPNCYSPAPDRVGTQAAVGGPPFDRHGLIARAN